MNCSKCGTEIEEPMVLKRGEFIDQPLCEKCFDEEQKKLRGD